MITIVKFENILYPFLRSSKTLLIYVEFPRLFIQRRNALSSLDTRASSGKVSRKDIVLFGSRAHSYRKILMMSFTSLNSLQTR